MGTNLTCVCVCVTRSLSVQRAFQRSARYVTVRTSSMQCSACGGPLSKYVLITIMHVGIDHGWSTCQR